jgi:hypothetical protein
LLPCSLLLLPPLQVVFAGFPDTSQLQGASTSLPAYFDSPQVQQQLEEDKEAQAGLVGRMSSLMDAVMSVQPLVRQFAESAKSAGSKLGSISSSTGTPLASRLAGDMGANSARAGSPDDEEYAAAAAWEQQQQGGGLARQVQGSAAAGAAAAQAAAANLAAGFEQASGELQGRLGSKCPAFAAAAALAVAAAGIALTRGSGSDGALTPAPGQTAASVQRSAATGSSSATTPAIKQVDKAQALKLVKRFQAAKAAALSSEFNTSQLAGVCVGNALQQFVSMSEDWASQGWFRTSTVWKAEIVKLEARSSSGQRVAVTARIGEKSSTWGIDGQQGNSWSNEYDVEYDVVLCSDLQWRIQGLQVRGKDAGAGGLFGIFGGGSGN